MQPPFECRSPARAVSELAGGNQERRSWSDAIFRVVHDRGWEDVARHYGTGRRPSQFQPYLPGNFVVD